MVCILTKDFEETLPHGALVRPIIGISDQTHLSNFSGDKKAWPVYITIGNINSKTRNSPTTMAILLLALLPVPPKFTQQSAAADDRQHQINADSLQGVFRLIFDPLQDVVDEGSLMDCGDGKVRRCFPVLAAWIADHVEHVGLNGLKSHGCPKCEVQLEDLETSPREVRRTAPRDYESYAKHALEYRRSKDRTSLESLQSAGIKIERNVFIGLSRVNVGELHKPDLLHNIYLGLFKHLMLWVEAFLKKHRREQAFDDVWKSLPPYPGFFVPKKAYREITQWQGKEMRNLGRCVSGVLASALRDPDPAQQQPFKRALACVNSLVDFTLIAQYRSHTVETLNYMDGYLDEFHRTKDVFLEFRVSKRIQAEVNVRDETLRHEQAKRANALETTKAKRAQIAEDIHVERNDKRLELIQQESHFNFIKMHLDKVEV